MGAPRGEFVTWQSEVAQFAVKIGWMFFYRLTAAPGMMPGATPRMASSFSQAEVVMRRVSDTARKVKRSRTVHAVIAPSPSHRRGTIRARRLELPSLGEGRGSAQGPVHHQIEECLARDRLGHGIGEDRKSTRL